MSGSPSRKDRTGTGEVVRGLSPQGRGDRHLSLGGAGAKDPKAAA